MHYVMVPVVKLVMQVKLLPTPEQAAALGSTLHSCNALANRVSAMAYEEKVFSRVGLQKLVYAELKAAGLSAQPALHVIRKSSDTGCVAGPTLKPGRRWSGCSLPGTGTPSPRRQRRSASLRTSSPMWWRR